MTVSSAIRDVLACPRCHGPLEDGPESRSLDCRRCLLRFPVNEGIPVMLLDRAERIDV